MLLTARCDQCSQKVTVEAEVRTRVLHADADGNPDRLAVEAFGVTTHRCAS